ncbi:MAG: hypothetical protein ACLQVL_37755 [Terriglobia bacterium]
MRKLAMEQDCSLERQLPQGVQSTPIFHFLIILVKGAFVEWQGYVKVVSIWSAGACSRFLGGQLAARPERASEQARRKWQQAAALHSQFAPIAMIPLSYSRGTLT